MKHLLILLIFMSSILIFGQKEDLNTQQILQSAISKTKEISFYSNTVNWDSLTAKINSAAREATTTEELKPAFEALLNGLRDHHGHIRKMSDYSILASFTDHQNTRRKDDRTFAPEIWKIVNDVNSRFEHDLLGNNIGYLKVVGIGPNVDGQKEAERIRNALKELHQKGVNQWIIDLRYNGGGNVNVMLAGLAPLLDTQKVVSIQDKNGEIQATAEIKDGDFWYAGVKAFEMDDQPKIQNPKIAILTSRWTWSSGEFVAVAFKGQKNTKIFGEKTGGFTTNNSWEIIDNKIALVISTGVYCDRNGNPYMDHVKPDKEIVFEVEVDKEKDIGILEALNWLKHK